jgi:hypothetical protein
LASMAFYTLAHYAFQILYPLDRAVLYLVVNLCVACFVMAAVLIKQQPKWAIAGTGPFFLLPLMGLLQFYPEASISNNWRQEQVPESFQRYVSARPELHVGGSYLLEPQWNFLQMRSGGNAAIYVPSHAKDTLLDFKIVPLTEATAMLPWYKVAEVFHDLALLERRWPLDKDFVLDTTWSATTTSGDFGFRSTPWPPENGWQVLDVSITLQVNQLPFTPVLVALGLNSKGEVTSYRDFKIGRSMRETNLQQHLTVQVDCTQMPEHTAMVHVYIWNQRNEPFTVHHASLKAWRLER